MHRKQFLTVALSAALCGSLALGSAVSAAPKDPTPASTGSGQEPPQLPPLPSLTTPPPADPAATPSPAANPWFMPPSPTGDPFAWLKPKPAESPQPSASGEPQPSPTKPEFDPAYDVTGKRKALAKTWKTIGKFGNGSGNVADFAGTVLSGEKDPKVLAELELKANASLDNLLGGFAGGPPGSDRAKAYRVLEGTIQSLKAENKAMREAGQRGDLAGLAIHAGFSMMYMSFLAADVFVNIAFGVVAQVLPFDIPEFKFTPPPVPTATPAQGPGSGR
ncbi:hypothetical protein H9Y04_34220 [Streptomyces sp. TRM66268-LWL]|uniref:Uncharacterized protein n=1 Tax=Streptomyces polyasparticus TaxID=2767826 RepID=A0ABR7SQ34_9ACTN|nr:hypothetical protein [Streptomyces polyasparticus]MBC9717600.1 hypothetical protein [Streptomyces polyasparticus]